MCPGRFKIALALHHAKLIFDVFLEPLREVMLLILILKLHQGPYGRVYLRATIFSDLLEVRYGILPVYHVVVVLFVGSLHSGEFFTVNDRLN